jgi:thiol:disulfide interchange protein
VSVVNFMHSTLFSLLCEISGAQIFRMLKVNIKTVVSLLIFFAFSFPVLAAESIKAPHVKISWLAPEKLSRTSPDVIGIKFNIDPDWHIYWKNSGDSGAPPKFNFKNGNYNAGPIQWPIPKRILVSHLINLGYEQETAFLFQIAAGDVPGASSHLNLSLNLEWLVCKEECIPGITEINLSRPLIDGASVWISASEKQRDYFASQMPRSDESPWHLRLVEKTDEKLVVSVKVKSGSAPDLFPIDGEYVNPQPPKVENVGEEMQYSFSTPAGRGFPTKLSFLGVRGGDSWEQSIELTAVASSMISSMISSMASAGTDSSVGNSVDQASLVSLLFFAFLGGIVLNLMPCVLPVLSMKFLSILKTSVADRRKESVLYLAGVLTTFFILGSVFLGLRSAGAAIGWGFQLQSPYIILLLILLFWLMALNFLGVFEFGDAIMNVAGNANSAGSFSTGVLAVFVAAPCTGPFMGTALGAAAILPAVPALGIFLSLGLGLGIPFVLVSFIPSLFKLMPKPGAWMDRLRQFLAFPLIGTVIWLMWVLGIQLGSDGWLLACTLLLLVTLSFWLGKTTSRVVKVVATGVARVSIGASFMAVPKVQKRISAATTTTKAGGWVKYDRAQIDQARAKGQAVFVDFTAAWCITCQLNKKVVLETGAAQKIFQDNDVLIMRADWTNQDPVITKALAEFNRNSVPVYLFYGKGTAKPAEAQILPQILTIAMIENLFNKKE